jgi:hypothetical protein
MKSAGGKEASTVSPGRTLSKSGGVEKMVQVGGTSNRNGLNFTKKKINNRGPQYDSGFSQVKKNGK